MNEPHPPELVHEVTDAPACGPDHFRQRLLADPWHQCELLSCLPVMREEQQCPRQPFFAGVEKLIHQILFKPRIASQHVGEEVVSEGRLVAQEFDNLLLQDGDEGYRFERRGRRHSNGLAIQTAFSQKIAGPEDPDHRFASAPGNDRDLHSSAYQIINLVSAVSLRNRSPGFSYTRRAWWVGPSFEDKAPN